jgi:hypothetical protein
MRRNEGGNRDLCLRKLGLKMVHYNFFTQRRSPPEISAYKVNTKPKEAHIICFSFLFTVHFRSSIRKVPK